MVSDSILVTNGNLIFHLRRRRIIKTTTYQRNGNGLDAQLRSTTGSVLIDLVVSNNVQYG